MLATWSSRATALVRAGQRDRAPDLLAAGVTLAEQVVATCAGRGRKASYLSNLALAWRATFVFSNREFDIVEALRVAGLAVANAKDEDARRGFRSNLAICHTARFERFGDIEDLGRAIDELRACNDGVDAQNLIPGRLSNFAAALASRYVITGARHDLDEAISLFSHAVEITQEPRERAEYLANQATAYQLRFVVTGDTTDLDLGVEAVRTAVRDVQDDPLVLPSMLNTLGLALKSRYQRTDREEDIREAITHFRSAMADLPPGDRQRAGHLNNLSAALRLLFVTSQDVAHIDEAVRCAKEAAATSGVEPATAARYQSTLGAALSRRFAASGDVSDLDLACTATVQAAKLIPSGDSLRAAAYANAGLAYRRRADHDAGAARRADLEAAATAYATSAATSTSPPLVRAISAQDHGLVEVELGGWAAAVGAFEVAIALLGEVTDDRLAPDDQGHQLTSLAGLGSMAAAAALADADDAGREDDDRAFSLLERGRGVLLSRMLSARGDLDDLWTRHERLASEFDRVRTELNQEVPEDAQRWESPAARRRGLSDERDQLLKKIRALPGLDRFLLPRLADDELVSPVDGPVVAINLAAHRCDAFIVTPEGVRHRPLPHLDQREATAQANEFLSAVYAADDDSDRIVDGVLRWMWNTFAGPILDELDLGVSRTPDDHPPRLWWIPTGALAVLPIHAAGHHDIPGNSVMDRVVSSYTPTLRTLREACARPAPERDRPLVVAVPETPGRGALAGARLEAEQVAAHLAAGTTCLVQDDAVRERVLVELTAATWAHFACHATTDPVEPFRSHLTLKDGRLFVRELASLRISEAWLAYLSACTTAFSGTALSDEAIHISSVFQLAGFPHVIGTLWRVMGIPAEKMASYVYQELTEHEPARAVHAAQHRLRGRYPGSPVTWAPHVHLGP